MNKQTILLISAYKPTQQLVSYIKSLKNVYSNIIVVNDGSSEKYQSIFNEVEQLGVHLISCFPNKGKGYALKEGYRYIQNHYHDYSIITVDSDGEYRLEDILLIEKALHEHCFVLGERSFKETIPLRYRIGNRMSSFLFYCFYDLYLEDLLTGLRGFHDELVDFMISVEGNRFDYEIQVLIEMIAHKIAIHCLSIQTVYEYNNVGLYYKTIQDSFLILRAICGHVMRFMVSSIVSSLLDIGLAWVFMDLFKLRVNDDWLRITLATLLARIISMLFNYVVNKKYVFKEKKRKANMKRFLILSGILILLSSSLVYCCSYFLLLNEKAAKPLIDILLFFVSYTVQEKWVFKKE